MTSTLGSPFFRFLSVKCLWSTGNLVFLFSSESYWNACFTLLESFMWCTCPNFYCLLFPTYLVLYFPLQFHFLILLCVLFCNEFNLLILEIEFCRACKLFTSQFTSLIAAVLFAVHPVHTEAVSTNNYTEAQKTWKQIKKAFFGLYNWLVFLLHDFLPNVVSIH